MHAAALGKKAKTKLLKKEEPTWLTLTQSETKVKKMKKIEVFGHNTTAQHVSGFLEGQKACFSTTGI